MNCPICKKGKIVIKEKIIEEKRYLLYNCNRCNYEDKIYLHQEINFDRTRKI